MPGNQRKWELRLAQCDEDLDRLFTSYQFEQTKKKLHHDIVEVKKYYNSAYEKTNTNAASEKVIANYEVFLQLLHEIQNGIRTTDEASTQIKQNTSSKTTYSVFFNLAKICELMFWAATALTLYGTLFAIVFPVLLVQPFLGTAVGITITGALFKTLKNCQSCIDSIESLEQHQVECKHEEYLVSFFKQSKPESQCIQKTDPGLAV